MTNLLNTPILGDCFDYFDQIEDKSIDLIFCDLPYGTTNCSWDTPIPLNYNIKGMEEDDFMLDCFKKGLNFKAAEYLWNNYKVKGLWQHYDRIIKDNGVILLFAQLPFLITLGKSNLKNLRYEWIWEKTQPTGFLNAKRIPLKAHENILVFYKKLPTYNFIKTKGHERKVSSAKNRRDSCHRENNSDSIYGNHILDKVKDYNSTERYPRSVQKFSSDKQKLNIHKTQKPRDLIDYMIKTYSNEGEIVLDNCAGSFVVAESCKELGRNYIAIEKDKESFDKALKHRKLK